MIIEKTATRNDQSRKELFFFENARTALKEVLHQLCGIGKYTLLLPGYIGLSPNEGSGIFDPVLEEKVDFVFYRMDKHLNIDSLDFAQTLDKTQGQKVVLFVHYFGYPDKSIAELTALCRAKDAIIIEDAAHALFTDFVDHFCGNYGDYTIYSLHKMLPFTSGGMLKINSSRFTISAAKHPTEPLFDYDFYELADRRKNNASRWNELLSAYSREIEILRPYNPRVTPQTFPIVIRSFDRNRLYFQLNESGFGAVSLYHTMIEPIRSLEMNDALWLSKRIINMPVHQDVTINKIDLMCQKMIEIIGARP